MPPNSIPKYFVLSSKTYKQLELLFCRGGVRGEFHSHSIYLFSTVCLHIKCPGAKSNQMGGLLAALLGKVPELLSSPSLFSPLFLHTYLFIY